MVTVNNAITNLKKTIGIQWQDESYLLEALTHSSYMYENKSKLSVNSNERLEFLGDAVLELIVSEHLFRVCPDKPEGELTKMRARIVCEPSLAYVSRKLNLGCSMFMGKGEERSGGRNRPSILADVFEALLGAIYLGNGYKAARDFALRELSEVILGVLEGRHGQDYKTVLQEYLQQRSGDSAKYQILKEEGPDHNKIFTIAVKHRGKILGNGQGHSKKEAEQQAARRALIALGEL